MKKVEERKQVELHGYVSGGHMDHSTRGCVWGDGMPIVRLGNEVGFVGQGGRVFETVEAAFVYDAGGCGCVAQRGAAAQTSNYVQALNKIAQFLALVALGRSPTEIASLIFYGEMFMFETFSSSIEERGLVEHVPGGMVDGYHPLTLTEEGEAGLRMCLQSELVDIPFHPSANIEDALEPLQSVANSEDEVRKLPVPTQARDMRTAREVAANLRAKRKPVRPPTRRTPAVD